MIIDGKIELAIKYYQSGNLQQAENICREILEVQPDNFYALNTLGVIYLKLGNNESAINYFKKALQSSPANADAYYNLGNAFKNKGKVDDAVTCYQKALQLNPDLAEAYNNLGLTLYEKGKLDDAITCYQKALQLNPDFADAYYNLGNALYEQGNRDKAVSAYDKAIACNPSLVEARFGRCMSQLFIIYPDEPSIHTSRKRYHDELIRLSDTISLTTSQDIEDAAEAVGSQQPFFLAYQGFNDRELQQLYGELICRIMALRYPQWAKHLPIPPQLHGKPLRIGIVSGYFYNHSTWKIPIKGWVENLNKKRFKLYGYYTGKVKDKETEAAGQRFTRFVEDIHSFENLCRIIRNDDLHVLIYPEIGMDPITAKLAAMRLAPVQCTSWGHPETSGFPTIDYYLSSDLMEPPDADGHYSEKLVRLPNLSIYYTLLDVSSAAVSREAFGLHPQSILYLCCQLLFKYLPQYDEVYPRIAQQVRNCQFVFISHIKSGLITEQFRVRINKAFDRFGLSAEDYVVFLPYLTFEQYLSVNSLSDIYLDSIGWSGCNSAFEAIAYDLPIVTLPTALMRGRDSAAILTMMEVTETIAASVDDYVKLAVKLGQNAQWRYHISKKITENKNLLYRDRTCITALEDFFERAIQTAPC